MNNSSSASYIDSLDIKQSSLDILRDLYSASRKLIMYPMDHPAAIETISKPLSRLNDLFRYKRSFVLKTYNKRLVAEGLLLEDNVFVNGLFIDFTRHSLETIEFKSDMTSGDLYHFLRALIEAQSPAQDYMARFLTKRGIKTIIVNSPHSKTLYNFEDTVVGRQDNHYLLDARVIEIIAGKQDSIVAYYQGEIKDDNAVEAYFGVDLRRSVIKNHIIKVIKDMPEVEALEIFQRAIFSTDWLDESIEDTKLEGIRKLWKDYSARSEDVSILLPVYNIFKSVGATAEVLEKVFDRGALIKLKAVRDAEEYIDYIKASQMQNIDFPGMRKTVFKLAIESYSRPLEMLLKQLLKSLLSDKKEGRQRGLRLMIESLQALADGSFWEINSAFIKEIVHVAHKPAGGYEIIELIGWLIECCASLSHWQELKICCQTLRGIANDKIDPRSKKAAEQLAELASSSVFTDLLVEAVISGRGDKELFDALGALKSSMVAEALLNRIDNVDKAVRGRVIKSLVTMGKGIGPDVTAKLAEIVGAGETSDDRVWYKLRNLLRVLGKIGYIEALPYMGVMVSWNQKRLKYEIIGACEDMQSPAMGVVLAKLALDKDREVRRSATIAIGTTEHPDMIKFLRDIFNDPRSEKALVIESLGRIGGPQARNLLIDLYENEDIYVALGISKKEEEQIKLAILKSLSRIGDDISKSKIELYGSRKKSGLFKKDILSRTASVLLDDLKP